MKFKILFFLAMFFLFVGGMHAQVVDSTALWTWMTGVTSVNDRGTSAAITVENTTNRPSSRFNGTGWADRKGNLWMYGGDFNNPNTLNDMWRYRISNNQWTWMNGIFSSGSNAGFNVAATYNVKGVQGTSATNPGGRRSMTSFTDTAGRFWLFGGAKNPSYATYLADLWMYDPDLNLWTYISGATTTQYIGNYGTKGTGVAPPSSTPTQPRARGGGYNNSAGVAWADDQGNFWLFGGLGFNKAGSATGALNDLWRYNPSLDEWTWMGGSDETNQPGSYGTKGVAAATNEPCGRYGSAYWKGKDGKFYMYGGANTSGNLSDLWRFDPVTKQWTWLQGSDQVNQIPDYGTRATFAASNTPGGRTAAGLGDGWVDKNGRLWLYGGVVTTAANTTSANQFEDLWCYDPALNQWAWMKGIPNRVNVISNYGTIKITAPNNEPGTRHSYPKWLDTAGNFWLLGGIATSNTKNDLWKLVGQPCDVVVLSSGPLSICQGDSVMLKSSLRGAGYTYQWLDGATLVGTDSQYIAKAAGSFKVQVSGTCNSISNMPSTVTINTLPTIAVSPATAVICNGKDTALTASGGVSYTWLPAGSLTGAATANVRANPTTLTTYTVTGTDANGCKSTATRTVTVNTLPAISISPATAIICIGKDTALTASGGVSYTWLPAGSLTGAATANVRANPTTLTTYTVTGTDANGCVNTATRQVTVNTLPTISITPAVAVICSGKDTALTGNGGATYTWAATNYTGSGTTVRVNPTSATTYTVTGTDANGCVNTATRSVSVNTLPLVTVTPTTAVICAGKDTALTGGGGISYVWLPNTYTGSGATIRATPTTTTTYTVTGTDANGCSSAALRTVTVNTLPTVSITGVAPVCVASTLPLTGTPSSGAWSSGTTANATVNASSGVVTGVAGGTSVITYSYTDGNKCTATDSKTVTVNALPAVPNPITGKTDLCIGDTTTLYSATTGGTWTSGSTGVATIGSSNGKVTSVSLGTTLITYTVTDLNTNCNNSINTNLNVRGLPATPPAITGASHVCVGAMEQLSNTITGGTWSSGNVNVLSISPSTGEITGVGAGMTSVKYTVNNAYSCKAEITTTMTVYNNPVATITPAGTVGFCDGDSITLTTATVQNMSYQWLMSQAISGAAGASYNAKTAGFYQVAIMDVNGCKDTSAIDTVLMYALPNPAITRNGQVLDAGSGYAGYQWYANGVKVNGATQSTCIVTQTGQYYVVVTDSNGCSKASKIDTITVGIANITNGDANVYIYPNPASNLVHIAAAVPVSIAVIGMDGKLLMQQSDNRDIDVSNLASGVYIIRIADRDGVVIKNEKLLKQ